MSAWDFFKKLGLLIYYISLRCCEETGLFALEAVGGTGHRIYRRVRRTEHRVGGAFRRAGQGAARRFFRVHHRFSVWRRDLSVSWQTLCAVFRGFSGPFPDRARLLAKAAGSLIRLLVPAFATVVNLLLPVAGIAVLTFVVRTVSGVPYALRVTHGGEVFGYISSESVYDAATAEVKQKMAGVETDVPLDVSAGFELVPLPEGEPLLDAYDLSDKIITASGGDIETAFGLYVDGAFINAVRDGDSLLELLASMQDSHLSGDPTETVRFIRPVALRSGIYPASRITTVEEVGKQINREVRGEFTYQAQAGDSASLIASKFDVPQSQIVANNPGILENLLIGQQILISRAEPYLAVQIQRILTYEEEEGFAVETQEDESLLKGERRVTRQGVPGVSKVRAAVTYVNDMESDRRILSREVIKEPVSQIVSVGSKVFGKNDGAGGSSFIVPVPGAKYISNYFNGYRGYRYRHGALDYAANYGTPILASASGTVTYSGYTAGGYGHHIIITHGSGYQTLYAHMSRRVAQYGDYVEQGQVIGYVGSTGRSTGNHCHFEIRVGGVVRDPYGYLYG